MDIRRSYGMAAAHGLLPHRNLDLRENEVPLAQLIAGIHVRKMTQAEALLAIINDVTESQPGLQEGNVTGTVAFLTWEVRWVAGMVVVEPTSPRSIPDFSSIMSALPSLEAVQSERGLQEQRVYISDLLAEQQGWEDSAQASLPMTVDGREGQPKEGAPTSAKFGRERRHFNDVSSVP